ncbi:hypothetical protein CRUP_025405 [Coryphaenoides rupestris]|nr:hypothetical protein CRUP_025405 [Coryphaenoides rupestris]
MDVDSSSMSSTKRKSRCPQGSGCSSKNSRIASTRSARDANSSRDSNSSDASASSANQPALPATLTETINILDNTLAGEEDVVDLTRDGTELAAVVDLTNYDSVVVSSIS